MRIIGPFFVCVAAILATSGCGGMSQADQAAAPAEVETPAPVETPAEVETPDAVETPGEADAPEAAAGAQPSRQWAMPNLVGVVLQDAQDQIQVLTGGAVYFTDSHDLGGKDRNQMLDANWRVCTQNIASGAALTPESKIDFGVVKLEESCP
jgi:hypothetical protein